jgi:hypothetical protein
MKAIELLSVGLLVALPAVVGGCSDDAGDGSGGSGASGASGSGGSGNSGAEGAAGPGAAGPGGSGSGASGSGAAGSGGAGTGGAATGGAGGTGDGGAGGGGNSAQAQQFCAEYEQTCKFGGNMSYPSNQACMDAFDSFDAKKQGCVTDHLGYASGDPDTHCPHAAGNGPCA